MISSRSCFKLHANCIPVLGHNRSVIVDLQKEELHFIPNALCELLITKSIWNVNEFLTMGNSNVSNIIAEYLQVLLEKKLILFGDKDELMLFPDICFEWEIPSILLTLVVDIPLEIPLDTFVLHAQNLGVQNLVLRVQEEFSQKQIAVILDLLSNSSICNLYIVSSVLPEYKDVKSILKQDRLLSIFFETDAQSDIVLRDFLGGEEEEKIKVINSEYFSVENFYLDIRMRGFNSGIIHFSEANNYNTFYNKRLFIDREGRIRFLPKSPPIGFFLEYSREEAKELVFNDRGEFWRTPKSKINICKDCEFRFVCSDSRQPIYSEKDKCFYYEHACPYDPYTSIWKESN